MVLATYCLKLQVKVKKHFEHVRYTRGFRHIILFNFRISHEVIFIYPGPHLTNQETEAQSS